MKAIRVPDLTTENSLKFTKFCKSLDINSGEKVHIDFSNMWHCGPFSMLICGPAIRKFEKHCSNEELIKEAGKKNGSYPGTMGFFKYISEDFEAGKAPGEARGSDKYIPITPINLNALHEESVKESGGMLIEEAISQEAYRLARVLVDSDALELHKLWRFAITEMIRNISDHSGTDTVWICGQYWPSKSKAEIAIADEGIGIYQSIVQNDIYRKIIENDNQEALKWALRAGVSKTYKPGNKQRNHDEWVNSGFGLFMVSEICKELGGDFSIVSYDNYLTISNKGIDQGEAYYQGTAVRISIPPNEISSAKEILDLVSSRGEILAKQNPESFQYASSASRGHLI